MKIQKSRIQNPGSGIQNPESRISSKGGTKIYNAK
jgi:hypothetical protein